MYGKRMKKMDGGMKNAKRTKANMGRMMYKDGGKAKKTTKVKNKKLAAMYGDPKKITRGDIITAAKMKKKKKK